MKTIAKLSVVGAIALFSTSAFAGQWWESDGFKKNHAEWAPKFEATYKAMKSSEDAVKTAQASVKAEADKAKRAELAKTVPHQGHRDTRTAWLKLHQDWRTYEIAYQAKKWDERTAAIKAAIASQKGTAKEVWDARVALFNAELAWIDANRLWKKTENDFQQKSWATQLEKLAADSAKK